MLNRLFNRSPRGGKCRTVAPLLWDFARGVLGEAEAASVAAHVKTCAHCRADVEAIRRSDVALSNFAATPIPPAALRAANFADVEARIRAGQGTTPAARRRFVLPPVAIGGVAALGVAGLVALGGQQTKVTPAAPANSMPGEVVTSTSASPVQTERGSGERVGSWVGTREPVAMSAEPAFVGMVPEGVTPLVVSFRNRGVAMEGELLTEAWGRYGGTTTIKRAIRIPSGDSKTLVYPEQNGIVNASEGENQTTSISVSFTGPRTGLHTVATIKNGMSNNQQVGYIGKGIGLLQPSQADLKPGDRQRERILDYRMSYCKPENAPDRAAGYDSLRTLVLGAEAETLSALQWKAIRDWVTTGGSVIVLGGTNPALLHAPGALALLPAKFPTGPTALYAPKPERTLGFGRVVYVGEDLISPAFRKSDSFVQKWRYLLDTQARPAYTRDSARYVGYEAFTSSSAASTGANNPFNLNLPPLRTVVFIFTGYFMLVVPVSFVVLKQKRRMNLAWMTGPLLALGFSGATYALNRDLYASGQAERTSGVLVAQENESEGRFMGMSEMFFHQPGTYTLRIPDAQNITTRTDFQSGNNGASGLEIRDNGVTTAVPALRVSSLSFRRVYHEQSVALGKGIQTDLRLRKENGSFVVEGRVVNGTGRVLRDVWVTAPAMGHYKRVGNRDRYLAAAVQLGEIAPGTRFVGGRVETYIQDNVPNNAPEIVQRLGRLSPNYDPKATTGVPYLVARTSGADFGPHIGKAVGGENSVTVAVSLHPLTEDTKVANNTQGGAK